MPNLGKLYTWSGSDFTTTSAQWRYIKAGTGPTLVDGGTTPATDKSAAGWIVSDELDKHQRCGIRVKAIKTAGAAITTQFGAFGVQAKPLMNTGDLLAHAYTAQGDGFVWVQTAGSVWTNCAVDIGNDVPFLQLADTEIGYAYFNFASNSVNGLIWPYRYVACQFPIQTDATISGHTFQFEAQWVYE